MRVAQMPSLLAQCVGAGKWGIQAAALQAVLCPWWPTQTGALSVLCLMPLLMSQVDAQDAARITTLSSEVGSGWGFLTIRALKSVGLSLDRRPTVRVGLQRVGAWPSKMHGKWGTVI